LSLGQANTASCGFQSKAKHACCRLGAKPPSLIWTAPDISLTIPEVSNPKPNEHKVVASGVAALAS
jgi:hypothetical protein